MNLVTLITGIVIAMAVLELLLQGMPNLKRDLFYVAMLVAWVGFTSKYYYGPDIATYAPLYDEIGNLGDFVRGKYPAGYELGYLAFTSLCKSLGMSYWWMTAVISTLFFYAVFIVLKELKDKRVLALALVLVIMKDLIYAQFRQCLAVSFFIFAIVEAERWKNGGYNRQRDVLGAVVLGLVAMTMHKSGIFMVILTFVYYALLRVEMGKNIWSMLLMLLLLFMIVPTWSIIEAIIKALDLGTIAMYSVKLHLSYMRLIQTNLLIYGMVLIVLVIYARKQTGKGMIVASAAAGMIVIVTLYQYYYIVDRLRSYFALILIYYAFSVMREASENKLPFVGLVRQVCEIVVIFFMVGKTYSFDNASSREQGDLLESCTVFDLSHNDAETIRKRQLGKADRFWDSDQRTDSRYEIKNK